MLSSWLPRLGALIFALAAATSAQFYNFTAQAQLDYDAQPQFAANAQPQFDAYAQPQFAANAQPQFDAYAQPQLDAGAQPQLDYTTHAQLDAYAQPQNCECVAFYQCDAENKIITDGVSIFDVKNRLGETRVFNVTHADCPKDGAGTDMKCCTVPPEPTEEPAEEPAEITREPDVEEPVKRLCGTPGGSAVATASRISGVAPDGGASSFGEFPWMLVLLKTTSAPGVHRYKCGASLIHRQVALTAAHCVFADQVASHYVVRAGEFDTSTDEEALPYQERGVSDVLLPANFNAKALYHDTALLRLDAAFALDDHIALICLPEAADLFDGEACVASGWGKQGADGPYSSVLRKVQLAVVGRADCQAALRRSRLGVYFLLDPSFVCAQGKPGDDTCDGDGGSPLMCPLRADPRRYAQAGVTAWGLGCGGQLPAAYASVARARRWIDGSLLAWGYAANDVNDDAEERLADNIDAVFNLAPATRIL